MFKYNIPVIESSNQYDRIISFLKIVLAYLTHSMTSLSDRTNVMNMFLYSYGSLLLTSANHEKREKEKKKLDNLKE